MTNGSLHKSSENGRQCAAVFETKAAELKKFVFGDPYLEQELDKSAKNSLIKKQAVFLSVCDKKSRAVVFCGTGLSLDDAWKNACTKTRSYISENAVRPLWLKADIVTKTTVISVEQLNGLIAGSLKNTFTHGVAFDADFEAAILSEQISTRNFTDFKNHKFDERRLRNFFRNRGVLSYDTLPEQVILFSCTAYFSDEDKKLYKLYPEADSYGRRVIHQLTRPFIQEIISTSADYLCNMLGENGKFVYGYKPIYDGTIASYNILRHSGALWTLMMNYHVTGRKELAAAIDSAADFLIRSIKDKDSDTSYVVEQKSNEIKLGGNGIAIISLSTYREMMNSSRFDEIIRRLANGILTMRCEDHSFHHILDSETFERKEKYRTVYYDGEATFALSKAYGITKDERYLTAACESVDYFIENGYQKYRDHWIGYAVNEITKYKPDERYFNFGLKNVNVNLSRIYNQNTTYHTYLELLMACFDLYQRLINNRIGASYLSQFNLKFFIETIYKRANHMLNGYMFPEIAMYMQTPEKYVGAFCVRHDDFRIRIDDIQHDVSAYYSFLMHFDELEEYRKQFSHPSGQEQPDKTQIIEDMLRVFGGSSEGK